MGEAIMVSTPAPKGLDVGVRIPLTAIVLTACIVVLVATIGGGAIGCGDYCAEGGAPQHWAGRVFDVDGKAAARATVDLYFMYQSPPPVAVTADENGRFCLLWPSAGAGAAITVVTHGASGAASRGYAAIAKQPGGPVVVWPPGSAPPAWGGGTHSGGVISGGFARDAPTRCVARAPSWYRFANFTSNWRYQLLVWLPCLGFLCLGAAAALRRHRETWRYAATVSAGGAVTLYVLVWVTHAV